MAKQTTKNINIMLLTNRLFKRKPGVLKTCDWHRRSVETLGLSSHRDNVVSQFI